MNTATAVPLVIDLTDLPRRPDLDIGVRAKEVLDAFLMLALLRGIRDQETTLTRGHLAVLRNPLMVEKIVYLSDTQDGFYARPVYYDGALLHLSQYREGPLQDTAFQSAELAATAFNAQMERARRKERILTIVTFKFNGDIIHIEEPKHAGAHRASPGR